MPRHDRSSRRLAAGSTEEGEVNFAPTYRYERGTREHYKWEKQKATHVKVGCGMKKKKRAPVRLLIHAQINVPSWCDRVLWKSFANATLHQTSYGCTQNIVTSDHSPVFATFDVLVANQYAARFWGGRGSEPLAYLFTRIPVVSSQVRVAVRAGRGAHVRGGAGRRARLGAEHKHDQLLPRVPRLVPRDEHAPHDAQQDLCQHAPQAANGPWGRPRRL